MAIQLYKYAYHIDWDTTGVGVVYKGGGGGSVTVDLSNYYTKLELQTSGQSSVHFDNITDAFHNNLLDLQGGLSTSSGDSSGKDAEYYHLDYESYALITDTPGVNKYFGTNGSGERGWYDYVTDSGCLWEEMSDGMLTPSNSNIVDLYILGDIHTDDDDSNVKLGVFAFASVTSGYSNIAIGKNALHSNTSGPGNIAIGESALYTNTEAQANIAIGYQALYANTVGELNIAVGFYALLANTEGIHNVGIGITPLYSNTVGESNVSIGFESLYNNTSGNNNLAIGFRGLYSNTVGESNVSIGSESLHNNTSGNDNIGIGRGALNNVSTGSNNIGIGYQAYVNDGEDINEIVIGNETTGQGSNTTIIGGANTIATYLISDIYVVTIDSFGTITPGLPLADSDITQVVMYDPITGKLSYAYLGDIGSGGSTGSGVDVYGTPKEHDIVVWHDGDTITNLDGFYILDSGSGYIEIDAPIYAMFVGNETIHDFYLQGYYGQSDDHDGGYISLMGGDGYKNSGYEGDGGGIELRGGDCYGDRDAGTVDIYGGRARGSGGYAGWVEITGGLGGPNNTPGSVAIIGGLSETNTNPGGDVLIYGGAGSNGGNLYLHGGRAMDSVGDDGDIYFGTGSEGLLKEAESSDVLYVVTYNPDTGKLGYTTL